MLEKNKYIFKWNKYLILLVTCFLIVTSISGCSTTDKLIQEAETSTVVKDAMLTTSSNEKEYGDISYEYLEYIQENLSSRTTGTESEYDTAIFIVNALLAIGYNTEQINIRYFDINNSTSQNIELTVPGKSKETVIIIAHYDSADTHGVDDNGSGVTTVLENAMRIYGKELPYTMKFIFFGGEELGTQGSSYYVSKLSDKDKDQIAFVLNVDSVLAGDYCYVSSGGIENDVVVNNQLSLQAYEAAKELDLDITLPDQGYYDLAIATSDHVPFYNAGVPYLFFIAIGPGLRETEEYGTIMHSSRDDLEFIEEAFPGRAKKTLYTYSVLLDYILNHLEDYVGIQ